MDNTTSLDLINALPLPVDALSVERECVRDMLMDGFAGFIDRGVIPFGFDSLEKFQLFYIDAVEAVAEVLADHWTREGGPAAPLSEQGVQLLNEQCAKLFDRKDH